MHPDSMGFFTLVLAIIMPAGTALGGSVKGKVQCKGMKDHRDAVVYLENVPG